MRWFVLGGWPAALFNQATRTLRAASELRSAAEHERLRKLRDPFMPLAFSRLALFALDRTFPGGVILTWSCQLPVLCA